MSKSIPQRAVDYAGDRSQGGGHGYPCWEASLIEKGYKKGAKDQKKLMYSDEDLREAIHESRMQNDKTEDYIFEQIKTNKQL